MSPNRRHRWIAWLLPLFILRAFVPVGFMVHGSAEGLQLVLCTGTGPAQPVPASAGAEIPHHVTSGGSEDHAQHHAASHGHHEGSRDGASHENSLCPFAAVGAGFIDALAHSAPDLASITSEIVGLPVQELLAREPISLHRIRGPPSLVA